MNPEAKNNVEMQDINNKNLNILEKSGANIDKIDGNILKNFSKLEMDENKNYPENINNATEQWLSKEVQKIGAGQNEKEASELLSKIKNEINAENDINKKIEIVSNFIEGFESQVGTDVAEHNKQNNDFMKSTGEQTNIEDKAKIDFYNKGKELRKELNKIAMQKMENIDSQYRKMQDQNAEAEKEERGGVKEELNDEINII